MFHYGTAKLREGVTRIKDGIVNKFLIEGSKKAVLFDTGLDIFNIKDYVAKLTKKRAGCDEFAFSSRPRQRQPSF